MTREDIIKMAQEAKVYGPFMGEDEALIRFAHLVVDETLNTMHKAIAHEREACARMVEDLNDIGHSYGLENRIRARGEQ